MGKHKIALKYTYDNPNTPKEVEQILKQILIEKLLALHRANNIALD